ncbi:putative transcription factor Nin-like family [Helianthus annuus]|nr:putative transcription factor Nin-like family [Helianthus annuus]KAJ0431674.1 putative transcription factor Nin-like family [Helianthus annuus]KAJ0446091.1 putative transcription factor Nin-like family [Helianthus annuus]
MWKRKLYKDVFLELLTCCSCYICVPTTVEFKKKIISLLQTLLFLPSESVLVQYWAAKEIGNTVVLTTTCQPFGLWGNNKELQSYHKGCSDHKLYVHPKEGVAFGLSGRVFLNRTHEQTRDVHRYPKYQRPPCEDAIFTKIWGSFAVPVIEADKCVGVLEFVMDTPKDSSDIIGAVYSALEHAGFRSHDRVDINFPRRTIDDPKRLRRTKSFEITKYCCLVPYFGLGSAHVAAMLGVKTSTFRNACRNVGIPEWPWIPNSTTNRASSDPESPITPTTSETSYFPTSIATESMPYIWNMGINNWSPVQTMITQAPFSEYLTDQMDCDTSPFGTLIATQYGSIGFPAETEYMASDPSSFRAPIYIDHMPDLSYLIPDWNVGSCESPYTQNTTSTEASLSEYIASDTSSFGDQIAMEDVGIFDLSTMTTEASSPKTQINQIASGTGRSKSWNIEFERDRPDFMLEFEMECPDLDLDTRGFF